jgi:hypothetical protein
LCCKGVNDRRIRSFGLPHGGDAKQYIQINYQNALRAIRKNEKDILIVIRDADKEDYDSVIKNFDSSVPFFVIPKRNIETWYYYLDNQDLPESKNEQCDRKKQYQKPRVKPTRYGVTLEQVINKIRQSQKPPNMPDSLFRTVKRLLDCEENGHAV